MSKEPEPLATAQQLGESFAAIIGASEWQVDEDSSEPGTLATGETESETPDANVPGSPKPPPMAEPVNETNVPPSPVQIIEALLFVGGPPLNAEQAAEAIRGLTPEQFQESIGVLNRVYRSQNRPYSVEEGPPGYLLRVSRRYAGVREKLYGGPREARLTQPALDVLSLVAYRQPVDKADIDGARGQDSTPILRQLVRLGLISLSDSLYSTTTRFLEIFRLRDLDDLPHLGEVKKIG